MKYLEMANTERRLVQVLPWQHDIFKFSINVAKSGILSGDLGIFWNSWDSFGIFILKSQYLDFLVDFWEREVWNLEFSFFSKIDQ